MKTTAIRLFTGPTAYERACGWLHAESLRCSDLWAIGVGVLATTDRTRVLSIEFDPAAGTATIVERRELTAA